MSSTEAATFGHPDAILGGGAEAALLFRWAFLGDLFYSYLLLVPLALYPHRRLRERRAGWLTSGWSQRSPMSSWAGRVRRSRPPPAHR